MAVTFSDEFDRWADISADYWRDGVLVRRTIARFDLQVRGPWAVILFVFEEFRSGRWHPPRLRLTKWRRVAQRWRLDSSTNLTTSAAMKLGERLPEVLAIAKGRPPQSRGGRASSERGAREG